MINLEKDYYRIVSPCMGGEAYPCVYLWEVIYTFLENKETECFRKKSPISLTVPVSLNPDFHSFGHLQQTAKALEFETS